MKTLVLGNAALRAGENNHLGHLDSSFLPVLCCLAFDRYVFIQSLMRLFLFQNYRFIVLPDRQALLPSVAQDEFLEWGRRRACVRDAFYIAVPDAFWPVKGLLGGRLPAC
ncbi:hypothetical protein [Pseudomonas sp. DWP3-1-2]|uniref:hypothetical protein n=1 Tax=Pseudomonas sp. DWP3-1-2 TaxID=2804645 RepID=UPI003CF199B4